MQPHFSYLSELWKTLVSYLNHLVELNKIKDHLDTILNEDLEKKFHELSKNLMDKSRDPQQSCVYLLEEVLNSINKPEMNFNALSRVRINSLYKNTCNHLQPLLL